MQQPSLTSANKVVAGQLLSKKPQSSRHKVSLFEAKEQNKEVAEDFSDLVQETIVGGKPAFKDEDLIRGSLTASQRDQPDKTSIEMVSVN